MKPKAIKWNLARGESAWHWQQWGSMRTECGRLPGIKGRKTSDFPKLVGCKICFNSPSCVDAHARSK